MATKLNYSVSLDGSSDAFSHADHADFKPTGSFTVGGWIKTATAGAYQFILQSRSTNTNVAGFYFFVNSTNVLRFISGKNTGTTANTDYKSVSATTTITDGNWHFVVATWDGSYINLYVDGVSDVAPVAWAYTPGYAATNYVRVGCEKYNASAEGSFFAGNLKGVFLINGTALTQAEIATKMFQDLTGTTNLKALYKFENNNDDSSGQGHDLTDIGTPTYSSGAEDVPHTYYLESADNLTSMKFVAASSQYAYINDNTSLSITGSMTIEAWTKFASLPGSGGYETIVGKYLSTGNQRSYAFTEYYSGSAYQLYFLQSVDGSPAAEAKIDWTPTVGVWYHLTCVYNAPAGSATFYINGTQFGSTQTGLNTSTYNSTAAFAIGQFGGSGFLNGNLKFVRVFDDIRTASEIVSDMFSTAVTDANLKGEWPLNGNLLDNTANDNDLTASGSPEFSPNVPFDARGVRQSLKLTGANYVTAASWKPTVFSVSGWIKPTAVGGGAARIIVGWPNTDADFYIDTDSKITLRVWKGAAYDYYQSASTITAGVWTFVACSYDSSSKAWVIYVGTGGSADASGTGASALSWEATASNMAIGATSNGNSIFTGNIKNIRLYDAVITGANLVAVANSVILSTETSLYSGYKLDNNYIDVSTNAKHLTPVSTPLFSSIVPFDGSITSSMKTWNGLAYAAIKTMNGLPIASMKTWNGLA